MSISIPELNLDEPLKPSPPSLDDIQSVIRRYISSLLSITPLLDLLHRLTSLLPNNEYVAYIQNHLNELWNLIIARIYISLSRPFVNFNRLLNSEAYWYPLRVGYPISYQYDI